MVASQEKKVFGIFYFVGEQEADGFQGLLATVDVVAQEQVVGLGWKAAVLEQTQQVSVLAVDVAAYFERRLQLEQDRLTEKYLARLQAQRPHLTLGHVDYFTGPGAARFFYC